MVKGVPLAAIQDSVSRGFETGRFTAPQRSGVAYMLSSGIRRYNPNTGAYSSFPPHVMFYAPNVTSADIFTDWAARQDQPWLPFVAYEGPHGMFIMIVEPGGVVTRAA